MYEYKAIVTDVYDGDTMTLDIQLGFHITFTQKVRLMGIDTPEIRTKNMCEKQLAYKARDYLRELLLNKMVMVTTEKQGKYGRYVVNLFYDDVNINNELIRLGFARVYDGGARQPW